MIGGPRTRSALLVALALGLTSWSGCGGHSDMAEEHVKLSLRIEHVPIRSAPAKERVHFRALVQSSLEGSGLEGAVRVRIEGEEEEKKLDLAVDDEGEATATMEGHPRGTVVHYVIEAEDAAGLVVTLPRHADRGKTYAFTFEGKSSRVLGGISYFSALFAFLLFLGAGACAIQNLRSLMSTGPAGLLGGFGVLVVAAGLFLLGGIHAHQVTGRFWPASPLFMALSRGDLAIVTGVWAVNLFFGRRVLLDQEPEEARGERGFSVTGIVAAVLLVLFAIF